MKTHAPRILAVVDTPYWVHDAKARHLSRLLEPDYAMRTRYNNEVTAADLDDADLILVFYGAQFDAMAHLERAFERNRRKLLIGVSAHSEIEGARGEPGVATLRRFARGIFAVSQPLYAACRSRFDVPLFYTPNGVDTVFYHPSPSTRPASPMRIGWAGSLLNHGSELRGYYELIVPAAHAVEGVELITAAREDKWRGADEMRAFYRSLDVYVCASQSEGTPNSCLEAAACGVPLLTTRVGTMPDLVRDGENSFFIDRDVQDIARRLSLLRDDRSLRASVAALIRHDIEAWDWTIRSLAYRLMFDAMLCDRASERAVDPHGGVVNEASAAATCAGDGVKDALMRRALDNVRALPPVFADARTSVDVTVAVLSYGRLDRTVEAVSALAAHVRIPFTLLLIDNGSTGDVREALRALTAAHPFIELVLLDANLGCTAGRMHALQFVKTEFVLFLDNDIEVLPGAVEHLLHHLESHPDVLAAAGHAVFADGRTHLCGADYRTDGGVLFHELMGAGKRFDDPDIGPSGDCRWVNAGFTLFRTSILKTYPLDTAIDRSKRGYFEDLEWCYRLNQNGIGRFARSVEALGLHHHVRPAADGSTSAAERRSAALPTIEAIAHFYRTHGVILEHLFSMPDFAPATSPLSRLSAKLFLDLVISQGSAPVLARWNAGELAPLFELAALANQAKRLEHRLGRDETVIRARDQAVEFLSQSLAQQERIVRHRDEAIEFLLQQQLRAPVRRWSFPMWRRIWQAWARWLRWTEAR